MRKNFTLIHQCATQIYILELIKKIGGFIFSYDYSNVETSEDISFLRTQYH